MAIDQLLAALREVSTIKLDNESDRAQLVDALSLAQKQVQRPVDTTFEHAFTIPIALVAIEVLIEAGAWKAWTYIGNECIEVKQLAAHINMEPSLLRRLLRTLAAQHYIKELDVDTFAPTAFSQALANDEFASIYHFRSQLHEPCLLNFPKFAHDNQYRDSTDAANSNFQHWHPESSFFEHITANPKLGSAFNSLMKTFTLCKAPWTDFYPVKEIAGRHKTGSAMVVDVGGNTGSDLERFRVKVPNAPLGTLILQDLPDVVAAAKVQAPCVATVHDFFQPQPVHGACVYYMHAVLHDWTDREVVKILRNIAAAMQKGYSRLLIHETVMTPTKNDVRSTWLDLSMMMLVSGHERSEGMWQDIVQKAGLHISKIHTMPGNSESILELELT